MFPTPTRHREVWRPRFTNTAPSPDASPNVNLEHSQATIQRDNSVNRSSPTTPSAASGIPPRVRTPVNAGPLRRIRTSSTAGSENIDLADKLHVLESKLDQLLASSSKEDLSKGSKRVKLPKELTVSSVAA